MQNKGLSEPSDGYHIALCAVTACYIFKECLKKINIDDEDLAISFNPRILREALMKEVAQERNLATVPLSRHKYLRERYHEIKVMLEAGKPLQTKQFNYLNFLPLMKFAGVAGFYEDLDLAFKQGKDFAAYSLKWPKIRFKVDKDAFRSEEEEPNENEAPDKALLLSAIPMKPPYFIGRAGKLLQVHQKLAADTPNILLLKGIGGMGKTTLMQAYLHEKSCRNYFDRIIFSSVNKDLPRAFIAAASLALGLEDKRRELHLESQQLDLVRDTLAAVSGQNLFVLDNVNESDFDDLKTLKPTLEACGWKLLITTRTVPDGFAFLDVDELEMQDAKYLFTYHYTRDNTGHLSQRQLDQEMTASLPLIDARKDLENLLGHIFRHTLLTELLAKSGRKKGLTVPQLLERLKNEDFRHPDLQRVIETGSHADSTFRRQLHNDTLHAYMLSLFDTEYLTTASGDQQLDREHEQKAAMLRFFSVLPPDDIPMADLKLLWRVEQAAETAFEDRLDQLRQIGWIQGKQDMRQMGSKHYQTYKMHPLIQEVVYEKLKPDIDNCIPLVISVKEILLQPMAYPQQYQAYAQAIDENLEGLSAI